MCTANKIQMIVNGHRFGAIKSARVVKHSDSLVAALVTESLWCTLQSRTPLVVVPRRTDFMVRAFDGRGRRDVPIEQLPTTGPDDFDQMNQVQMQAAPD